MYVLVARHYYSNGRPVVVLATSFVLVYLNYVPFDL